MSVRTLAVLFVVCPLAFAGCGSSVPESVALTVDEQAAAKLEAEMVEDAEREQQRLSQAGMKKK